MVPLETVSYSTKVLVLGWAQMIALEGHLGPQKDYYSLFVTSPR